MFKYRKSVIVLVLGSLVFAFAAGGRFPSVLLYSILLTVIISFIWTRLTVVGLSFSQEVDKNVIHTGEEVEIRTIVKNRGIIPVPYIEIANGMIKKITGISPNSSIISLKPLGSKSLSNILKCRYRGIYSFGPVDMYASDVFGLFSWNRKVDCSGELYIYPRAAKLHRFNVKPAQAYGMSVAGQRLHEDYTSVSDIKKYFPGDSYRKIHWKVSAKKGSLHVKNFDMSGSAEAHIFLNMFYSDFNNFYRLDMEEKAVECAATVAYYTLSKNINTSLYANCRDNLYIKGRGLKEFNRFMGEFIRVKSDGSLPASELLELKWKALHKGASIIIVTPNIYKEYVDGIIQLKERGFDVIIICITIDNQYEKYKEVLSNCEIPVYKIGISDDVGASLEG